MNANELRFTIIEVVLSERSNVHVQMFAFCSIECKFTGLSDVCSMRIVPQKMIQRGYLKHKLLYSESS